MYADKLNDNQLKRLRAMLRPVCIDAVAALDGLLGHNKGLHAGICCSLCGLLHTMCRFAELDDSL